MPFTEQVNETFGRIKSAFTAFYFTQLSIIQGVALAALFAKVDSLIAQQRFHAPQVVLAGAILLLIVGLWNQYYIGINLYVWTSSLLDAFIPFLFGVFEFVMIIALEYGSRAELVAFGLLFLGGIIAFEHQYWQLRMSKDRAFYERLTAGFRKIDLVACVVSSLILFAVAAIIWNIGTTTVDEIACGLVIVAVQIGQLAREHSEWRTALRRLGEMA